MLTIPAVPSFFRYSLAALLLAGGAMAQVKLTQEDTVIHVNIDGKPFGDYHTGTDASKPYFSPLRSASGKLVTRQYPMAVVEGESHDHPHHLSVWLGYIDVNGTNFWENEVANKHPTAGHVVVSKVKIVKTGGKTGTLRADTDWINAAGEKLLTGPQILTFHADPTLRIVDFDATLTADVHVLFGDDKDGAFGVRIADALTEKPGSGVMTNSHGATTMKDVWGKPADWVDYNGTIDGEPLGILIMEHPDSFHHPTRWHARDYGLFAANPFAAHAYDPTAEVEKVTLEPGKSIRLRYRIVIHPKLDADGPAQLYKAWAAEK